jgi:hypothetical protein
VQTEGFYAVETAGVWARGVELPLPSDVNTSPAQTTFVSASCVAGGTCQLLGEYVTDSIPPAIHSVVDTYVIGTGLTGTPQEISQLSGYGGIELTSISCTTSSTCVAVGAETSQFAERAVYIEENGGVWGSTSTLKNPLDGPITAEFLSSLSCVAPGDCVAAGDWLSKRAQAYAETYTEEGGVWGPAVDLGEPLTLGNPFVDDISCVAAVTSCTLVGALSDIRGGLHAATAQMTAGHWGQLAPAGVPGDAITDHELLGVSCDASSGIHCTAVGYYNENSSTGGTESMGAMWGVNAPPGQVTNLHKASEGRNSVIVAWSPPANFGSGFEHYEVLVKAGASSPVDRGGVAGTSAIISKLSPGIEYKVSVFTVATDGQISPLSTVAVSVPATLPSAPRITRVISLVGGLRVIWDAPRTTGGAPIMTYKVTASCAGASRTVRTPGSSRQASIEGLPSAKRCVARVFATNKVGTGPASAPALGRTK